MGQILIGETIELHFEKHPLGMSYESDRILNTSFCSLEVPTSLPTQLDELDQDMREDQVSITAAGYDELTCPYVQISHKSWIL